jgi:hypothetical protein
MTTTGILDRLDRMADALRRRGRATTPATSPMLDELRQDPSRVLSRAGMAPDGWQAAVLRSRAARICLNCCRQSGKSSVAAALAVRAALLDAGSLTLLLSPSLRQSSELYRKARALYDALGRPVRVARETQLTMELANGARIVSLPESEGNIRGFSGVRLAILDEASRIADVLMAAVRPMLATSAGRLVALSTPFGQRGWWYEVWQHGEGWERVRITADQCPRIPPDFLAAERAALGPRWFAQEYLCSFEAAADGAFFPDDVAAATSAAAPAWLGGVR